MSENAETKVENSGEEFRRGQNIPHNKFGGRKTNRQYQNTFIKPENNDENVEGSTNETSRKNRNYQPNKFGGKRTNSRYSNEENLNDSSKITSNFDENNAESMENDQRRSFGKPYPDRIEDKVAQLSYNPTIELPPIDLSEKKFGSKTRIYIANVSSDTSEEDIAALFKPYGETSQIFVNKEKHFAFVKMDYYNNAQKAQKELDGATLKDKTLKVKSSPNCVAIKVKNLGSCVTNELLHYAFSVFGEIESATVLVDEKGKSTGEGIIYFARKISAVMAVKKCKEKCYFLTHSLKPVVVEHYDFVDQTVGLLDKHFNLRNFEFSKERSTGPRLADLRSFDHEYGSRWKALYDLHRQKEEALRLEFRLESEKLEAQMEYARFEHETESLREQLRRREADKERQKMEWEAKERQAEEERLRAEAQIRQSEEEIQTRLTRQHEAMRRRQEEANLLMQAKNLTSILDTQEMLDYNVPTSSGRGCEPNAAFNVSGGVPDMALLSPQSVILECTYTSYSPKCGRETTLGHYQERSENGLLGSRPGSDNFESAWNRSSSTEGHWVREDGRDRGSMPKRRRNMVVLRVHGEEFVFPSSLHHPMQPRIPQMNMMKVHIPFTFKLLETSRSSYSELQCSMSSQVRYQVHAYWGVNIRELHIFLWRPWADIKNACAAGDFLKGYYQSLGVQLERKPHSDQVITLNYNCQKPLDLGTPPRLCYPLVIFLIRNGINENIHPDETVALINVVHIKDSVCTLPTSILGQYLKQANGQLSCLKQLYLATGNSGNFESSLPLAVAEPVEGGPSSVGSFCQNNEDSTFWNSSGEQLCVVCQTYPLSRALLPCRHTCICASCFNKLERCPMCRGPIKSYFCIRGEEYMHTKENTSPKNEEVPPARRRWFNGIQNWDDRLIDFLGFSR